MTLTTRAERLRKLAELEAMLLPGHGAPKCYVRYLGGGGTEAGWGEGGEPPSSGPRPEDLVLYVTFVGTAPPEGRP